MKKKLLLILLVGSGWCHRSLGCDLCAVYAASEAQGTTGRGFFGGLAGQYTFFDTYQSNGHNATNPDEEYFRSLISQVFFGYNFNNRFGLQLNLPIIYREYSRIGAHGSDWGPGDLALFGNVRLYRRQSTDFTFSWTALGGIKFPTGDPAHLNPAEADFATGIGNHDLALGSGSYDGLVGTGLFGRWKRAFLTADMQYAIRTEGAFDYQYANDWTWFGGPGVYLLLADDYTLAFQGIVSGESKGEDTRGGMPTDDTAMTIVYLGPQLNFTWGERFSAQLGADFPMSTHSSGEQITPSYRVRMALTWRF